MAERSTDTLLEVQGLSRRFGGLQAVDDLSFAIPEGQVAALIGPNGAGKSTAFHLISGFVHADTGSVRFSGQSLDRLPAHGRARRGLVRTFQIPKVFPRLTVRENLDVASPDQPARHLSGACVPLLARRRAATVRARTDELLETFGLAAKADDYAGELSGGQRKLLEFARALVPRPRMLLLDEPLAGVLPALGEQLFEHVERLRRDEGMTFLFVEHDLGTVMRASDRVLVMAQGALVADGTPDEVRADPLVVEAYLGAPDEDDG